MVEKFDFKAPQYIDSWEENNEDDENMETFFKENEDPQSNCNMKRNMCSTPKNSIYRPHSTSVVSRSGRRCQSSFRDSFYIRERDRFKEKNMNQTQEKETNIKFKARPAHVLMKEPFWPYRPGRYIVVGKGPALNTEERSIQRKHLREKKKKKDELFEAEKLEIMKEESEELKLYRKKLEFKATAIKK